MRLTRTKRNQSPDPQGNRPHGTDRASNHRPERARLWRKPRRDRRRARLSCEHFAAACKTTSGKEEKDRRFAPLVGVGRRIALHRHRDFRAFGPSLTCIADTVFRLAGGKDGAVQGRLVLAEPPSLRHLLEPRRRRAVAVRRRRRVLAPLAPVAPQRIAPRRVTLAGARCIHPLQNLERGVRSHREPEAYLRSLGVNQPKRIASRLGTHHLAPATPRPLSVTSGDRHLIPLLTFPA